jgi:hypothetical protein
VADYRDELIEGAVFRVFPHEETPVHIRCQCTKVSSGQSSPGGADVGLQELDHLWELQRSATAATHEAAAADALQAVCN